MRDSGARADCGLGARRPGQGEQLLSSERCARRCGRVDRAVRASSTRDEPWRKRQDRQFRGAEEDLRRGRVEDAEVGADVNVGAGTITCNYDGREKRRTVIQDGAFIGSDSQLIAPVTVGKGAYVGAGSSITNDVPPGALGIARGRQVNVEGWAERRKAPAEKA